MALCGMPNTDDQHRALLIKVPFPQCKHQLSRLTCHYSSSLSWDVWALSPVLYLLRSCTEAAHWFSPRSQTVGINSRLHAEFILYENGKWLVFIHISYGVLWCYGTWYYFSRNSLYLANVDTRTHIFRLIYIEWMLGKTKQAHDLA